MYSSQVATFNDNDSVYHFKRTLTTVPIVDKSLHLNYQTPGLRNPPISFRSKLNDKKNDHVSEKSKMSLAFKEVYNDLAVNGMKENQFQFKLSKDTSQPDSLNGSDKLLLSADNARPKSRARTALNSKDLLKEPVYDIHSATTTPLTSITKSQPDLEDVRHKQQNGILSPVSCKDISNNANEYVGTPIENNTKRGKKSRKRANSSMKNRKGKQGRLLTTSTGLPADKRSSVPGVASKPGRALSEASSKISPAAILSFTTAGPSHESHNKSVCMTTSNKPLHDMYTHSFPGSAKSNPNPSSVPQEQNTHEIAVKKHDLPLVKKEALANELTAQGTSVAIYRLDNVPRIKSASSSKTLSTITCDTSHKDSDHLMNMELSLNAIPCAVQNVSRTGKPVVKYKKSHSNPVLSSQNDSIHNNTQSSKETVLTSIYGAVYHAADKTLAQAEQLKKVKKIFLSDKQSGTLKDCGMEFPCAPPATPTPDVLRTHEYVPSMSDIRSQRAVKGRLQVMEKEAQKKKEKLKEANIKLEKQQSKDREKLVKAKQRREIYALNKIMTELENKRFLEFCQNKGLNKV